MWNSTVSDELSVTFEVIHLVQAFSSAVFHTVLQQYVDSRQYSSSVCNVTEENSGLGSSA